MNKFNLLILAISCFLLLTGCAKQEEIISESPISAEPVSETVSESIAETNTESAPVVESVFGLLHVRSDTDQINLTLDSDETVFERFNDYTGELKYSFQLEAVNVEIETIKENHYLTFSIAGGEKLYDWLGDDAERKMSLLVKIKDSSGMVIKSESLETKDILKTGDHFDDLKFNISLEPGDYTLAIHEQPESTAIPVMENREFLNPEKWYTVSTIRNILEENAEFPFDTSAEWVKNYASHELYIDEELRLHGIFTEPYDLHEAEYERKSGDFSTPLSDYQYGDIEYYNILNPEGFSEAVPEDAVPDNIRVSLSPQGSILFGERPGMYVFFGYKYSPEDEYNYIALGFESHPGKALTQEEWDRVINRAEEQGIELSELAER